MSEEFKIKCSYCAEEVKPGAKVCPHCRQWLSTFSFRNPAVFVGVFYSCGLAYLVSFLIFFSKLLDPGVDFSPYRDKISIVESRMNLEEAGDKSSVHVVAVITNQTEIAWKLVQFEVQFFDKSGVLIDANGNSPYGDTLLPHGELAFRVNTRPIHPLAEYQSYQILIRSARDARCMLNN